MLIHVRTSLGYKYVTAGPGVTYFGGVPLRAVTFFGGVPRRAAVTSVGGGAGPDCVKASAPAPILVWGCGAVRRQIRGLIYLQV